MIHYYYQFTKFNLLYLINHCLVNIDYLQLYFIFVIIILNYQNFNLLFLFICDYLIIYHSVNDFLKNLSYSSSNLGNYHHLFYYIVAHHFLISLSLNLI